MSESADRLPRKAGPENSSDLLLWLAALVVALVGAAWLWVAKPWSGNGPSAPTVRSPQASVAVAAPAAEQPPAQTVGIEDWLRMGELARESGMLLDPKDYSAWTLYTRVLDAEPGNAAAAQGLSAVADALAERGRVALEQGRADDARELRDLIADRLPAHAGAAALTREMEAAAAREEEAQAERERAAAAEAARQRSSASPSVARSEADPIKPAFEAFEQAVADNRLLTPSGDNAREYLDALLATDPQHELTQRARRSFFEQLLARAQPAIEALDTQAATTWIDQAAALGVDAQAVAAARELLATRLIASESQRLIPATELELVSYVPPEYPTRAATRGLEGWVDVEFVVDIDGTTRDAAVTDSSNAAMFGDAALAAVAEWRFKPRSFMDRSIAQRTFTRIRFALQ